MSRYVAVLRLSWAAFLILAVAAVAAGVVPSARAQTVVGVPVAVEKAGPAPADLESLLATLRDPAARAKLEQQIEALITVQKGSARVEQAPDTLSGVGSPFLRSLADQLAAVGEQFSSLTTRMGGVRSSADWLLVQVEEPERRAFWLLLLGQLLVVALAATVAWFLVRTALHRPRSVMDTRRGATYWVRVPLWFVRTLLDLLPIAAFAAGAYGALALVEPQRQVRLVALAFTNAVVLSWVIIGLARALLAPLTPGARLFPLADATAAYLYVWVRRIVNVTVFGFFFLQALLFLGLPFAGFIALTKIFGLLVVLLLAVLVLQNRALVRDWLQQRRGEGLVSPPGGGWRMLRNRLADVWHILALLYLGAAYVIWALEIQGGFALVMRGTLQMAVAIAGAWLLLFLIRRSTERLFDISDEVKARYPGIEARANRYIAVLRQLLEIVIYSAAGIAVLQGWGVDVLGLFGTPVGRMVIARVVSIVLIALVSLLVWEIASAAIDRLLRDNGRNRFARSARGRTLLPLARNVIMVVISTMAVLAILSELGINIAPLLAGAGVIGLAVGFGAQTLVKDIITGAFILFEDTIAIGDVVTVSGKTGTVEVITIRTIRLRDVCGTLHTIPFSAVDVVTNLTKDFAIFVADIPVGIDTDTDRAARIMAEVGAELSQDKAYGIDMLAPFEVIGLDRFDKATAILRGRVKTRAGQQWRIGREYNRRIRMRFAKEGIDNPFRVATMQIIGAPPPQQMLDPNAGAASEPSPARQPKAVPSRPEPTPHPEDEP